MTMLSKKIGAGLALLALIGPGIGIGLVFSSLIKWKIEQGCMIRNIVLDAILGFALENGNYNDNN